jgi:hypothetical protein
MHFFLLLVPFIIILGAFVVGATVVGFLTGLLGYAFNRDTQFLSSIWIIVTTIIILIGIFWLIGLV